MAHGTKSLRLFGLCFLVGLGYWGGWLAPACSGRDLLPDAGRRYGPTTPGGYYVRITPSALTMAHMQQPPVVVTVEDDAGQPIDDILVSFLPSEGTVVTETSHTRSGTVTGTFTAATGSDSPRTAFVVVTVENVEVTVFIDIVPAVFGR
jgi:hypothetical protein